MMSRIIILAFLCCIQFSFSQEKASVQKKIIHFFELLKQKNHSELSLQFSPKAQLTSVTVQPNQTKLNTESVAEFTKAIQNISEEVNIEEKVSGLYLQVNGQIAFASMNYEFYVNGIFSHKGTNYFQFIWEEEDWLILHILDTRVY